jgi:hypothetical protein
MTRHDYLVLGMAALFLVTNFLGLGFTIWRRRSHPGSSRRPHAAQTPVFWKQQH